MLLINLIPFDDIEIGTELEYVIEGLIPAEGLMVCYGPPKSLKSFWIYDMAMHVALGWEYRGRYVKQGPVVYCAFEGQHGFKKRCAAFRQRFLKDRRKPVPFYLQPLRLDLIKEACPLGDVISKQLDGVNPNLIALDTLNRSLRGSENKDEDMGAYIAAADLLRQRFKCAVIIVHHCGIEAGRPRGHTSLAGAGDAQLAVKRMGKTPVSTLTVEFMKDGEE
jgi:RecA-family ATPase